jgi:hypothetical protein
VDDLIIGALHLEVEDESEDNCFSKVVIVLSVFWILFTR